MAVRHAAFDEPSVCDFIEDLAAEVEADPELQEETSIIHNILTQMARYQDDRNQNAGQKWKLPPNGQPICLFSGNITPSKTVIRPDDDSEYQNSPRILYPYSPIEYLVNILIA